MIRTRNTILHCIPSMGGGGAERQLTYLAQSLCALGWHVHVAYNRDGPNLPRLRQSGATLHRLDIAANHDPRLALRIAALVRRVRPSIVQTWLPQMDLAAGLVATMLNVPWVVSERSSEGSYPPGMKTRARRTLARGSAAAIIANSEGGARYWAQSNGAAARAFIVPNGIPLDEIQRTKPANLEEFGVARDEPLVVFVGRFSPEKNLVHLIDALAQAAELEQFKALLCGDGPLLAELRNLVARRGLTERVVLPGYIDDVWGLLKRSRVLVSISSYEGHPNGVMEALACGCSVVVSEIDAHLACVDGSVTDFVPLNDVAALRDAIVRRLRLKATDASAESERAQAFAQKWSLTEIGKQYDAIYSSILSRSSARLAVQAS